MSKPACQLPDHIKYQNGKCRSCSIARAQAWHKANPEKAKIARQTWNTANKQKRAERHREFTYGLTPSAYELLLQEQDGRCAVCLEPEKLAVDHDHITGKVRGLLCFSCNAGLGQLGDSIQLLKNALSYLEKHND